MENLIDLLITETFCLKGHYIYVFVFMYCICCLIKFIVEMYRGSYNYFDHTSYLDFRYKMTSSFSVLSTFIYKLAYVIKFLCVASILTSHYTQVQFFFLALCLLIEQSINFKFHTSLFFAVALSYTIFPIHNDEPIILMLHK